MPAPERIWLTDHGEYDQLRRQELLSDDDLILWSAHRQDDDDTGYVRADIHQRALALLREATQELRAEVESLVLSSCALRRNDDGTLAPDPDTLLDDDAAEIDPLLHLIRRIEDVVGRPTDSIAWLDRLLDARQNENIAP
ncbi:MULTISPECIES: hypothetical protein [unclassified Paracoccus (in: a-proteobacteria)]|uniref:hypothetical protein n=1 Tax=unclassified Paracoccus (in: a-proteobacteria) TaxID=2688777 RepID=UPI0012B35C09|nr:MULTISPECIES: hypothetical protein [unclassified Paracoccus (in: a-proteobacteria)]UXU75526.1 hypothetical protein GB879_003265 [Paracoccus sp. SMMA_5]UXU81431.1 hypothetical protein GB880_003260 [Paracoccus sp. SMMA_5_TC]